MITEKRTTDMNIRIQNLKAEVIIEDGKSKAKIAFKNCVYGTISAMKFNVHGYNSFSEVILVDGKAEFIVMLQDLNVAPMQAKEMAIVELPNSEIRKIDVLPYQICYSNGTVVNVESPNVIEYEIEKLQSIRNYFVEDISESEQLNCIRKIRENAIGYPKKNPNGWICICGELNKEDNAKCAICGSEKELIFSACSKENVIKKCNEERASKKAEEDRRKEGRKRKELAEKKKEQQIAIGAVILVAVCILVIVLWRVNYVKTYGMDAETHAQWKNALQSYTDWRIEVLHAWIDDGGYDDVMEAAGDYEHTYSEIYSMSSLNASRNAVLDKVGEIDLLVDEFPEKYRPVIKKLAEYQKIYYIKDIDVTTVTRMCASRDYLSNGFDENIELIEDIERLEGYLEEGYLHTDKMDLSTDVRLSYSPKTFSYSYESGSSYSSSTLSSSEVSSAKRAADSYCQKLINMQSYISTIHNTGISSNAGGYAHFKYEINCNDGTTQIGTVTVKKDGSSWKATGMDLD